MPIERPILRSDGFSSHFGIVMPYRKKAQKKRGFYAPPFLCAMHVIWSKRTCLFGCSIVNLDSIHFRQSNNGCQNGNQSCDSRHGKNIQPVHINYRLPNCQHTQRTLAKGLTRSDQGRPQPFAKIVSVHYLSFLSSNTVMRAPWSATLVFNSSICSPWRSILLSWLS